MIGAPAILLAVVISIRLVPPTPMNVIQLLRFLPLFLLRSLLAAFDVARRTFALRLPIAPAEITYDMSLPAGAPQVVFMNTVSLLPGTLSAALDNGRLTVHVLDHGLDHAAELARLELTIARIFPGPGA